MKKYTLKNTIAIWQKMVLTGLLFLLFNTSSVAQDKKLERAIRNYENREYRLAIDQLKKLYQEDKEAYTPIKYIANSYRKIKEYDNAELFYNLLVNSVSAEAEDHLYYGQVLKANGKLAAAKEQFVKFTEKSQNSFLGNLMVQSFDQIETWEKEPKSFEAKSKMGLNSPQSEYGLVIFKDKYYITSNREKNYNSPESFSWDGSSFMSIYELDSTLINSSQADFELVKGRINTEYHDGPLTIDSSSNVAIITRIGYELRGKDFENKMKLYEGKYEDGKWKDFEELPFNDDNYSVGHACFGESSNIIYFASDKPGGFGGMDLYKSIKEGNKWGEPVNLGAAVNTANNEVFPYYRNGKLYFSSNGFAGYGGLDLLVSEYKEGWQSPVNLKSPINSNRDDFGIYFVTDSTGYYASNREGGRGNDDIYSFYKSSKILAVGMTGVFEYKGLPVKNTKIILVDSNDSLLAVEYTDEEGKFHFSNLPYQENVLFAVEAEDPQLQEEGRLYLTNKKGEKIKLLERLKNGKFKFKALPIEEVELELLALQDAELDDKLRFAGKVYKKLPGDYGEQILVYLKDSTGQIVDSIFTDQYGNFEFKKLGLDEGYFVQVKAEELDLNVAFINEKGRFYEVNDKGDGNFQIVNNNVRRLVNKGYTGVIARLEFMGKPLPYTRVEIYDGANSLIATVFTNEKGEFQYNKLQLDKNYFFSLPEAEDSTLINSKLYVINAAGDPLYLLKLIEEERFSFKALPFDEYEELRLLEESLVPELVELKGQLFKRLQGDFTDSVKVYLLDETGLIIDSVYSKVGGKFNFEKLDPDKSYSFRVDGEEDYNLALLDNNDKIIEQAIVNENGNFTYKKLTYQVATFEQLEVVDAQLIEDELTHEIMGQVYQKLPGDFDKGMEVYIYSEDGKLVGTALTDEEGKFHFKKLDPDGNYYFRIEHHEEDFQLVTLDEDAKVIDKTIKNEKGLFTYQSLDLDHHTVLIEDAKDHHQVLYFDEKKIELDAFTVYYRFDTVKLNTVARQKLNSFVDLIKGQNFIVEVHSYTDNRGPEAYNIYLSKQRTDEVISFLVKKGIERESIIGNYYGELKPVVDCETKECDNDDHLLNRRTVLKLRTQKDSKKE